uniref:DUF11 domain-containing protein n=1 Tax=Gorillibacterium massiliense TaxID=1280390 RepID=UPI0005945613
MESKRKRSKTTMSLRKILLFLIMLSIVFPFTGKAFAASQPALVITASPNVSLPSGPPGTVTLSASASLSGGAAPTGSIQFTITGPSGFSFTQTTSVSGNGIYTASITLPTTGPIVGTYTWTVRYGGDSNNAAASDQGGPTVQTIVNAAEPTLVVNANPTSVTIGPSSQRLGASANLAAGYYPTGTITFRLLAPDGATTVDTETVTVNGNGTYTTPTGFTLPSTGSVAGTYTWTASYGGDSNNAAASDQGGPAAQTVVSAAGPTLVVSANPTSVTIGSSSQVLKASANLAAGYYPTGTITFRLLAPDGATTVDTETVTVNGNGTYTTPTGFTLPSTGSVAGTYQWDVSYSGDPNNNSVSSHSDCSVTVPQQADLSITNTVSSATPNVGDTITFTVTVTNNGPDLATAVEVTDLLPAGLTLVSAAPSQGTYISATGAWTVGTVTTASPASLTLRATVVSPAAHTNTATISHADQLDPNTVNNTSSATVTPQQADLIITNTVSSATLNVGDTITFTVTVANNGPDSATGVTVTDLLPAGLTFVSATSSQGSYNSATGAWTVGTVTPASAASLTLQATVVSPTAKTNTATISHADQFDPNPGNNTSSATVTVAPQHADLSVTNTVSSVTPNVGDTITF